MTRDASDDNKNLPPWLRDVPLPPRPRDAAERANPRDTLVLPDWLRDSDAETAGPPPAAPSWMDSPAQPPAPAQTSEAAALPDWLRDTSPSSAPSSTPEQLPSWLRDLAGPEAQASEPPVPPEPAPMPPSAADSNLPDWLRDTQRDNPPPTQSEQLPSWLSETVKTPDAGMRADTGEPPPRLSGLDEPPTEAPATTPDWLGELSGATQPTASDTDIPSWLRAESEPIAPPESIHDAGETGYPESTGAESIDLWGPEPNVAPEPPPSTSIGDAAVPDWLRDISADDASDEITAEPFSFEGMSGPSERAEPAGPPAWLSGGEETSDAVPDWLRSAVSQSEDLAGAALEPPDAPLWLQDLENKPADIPAAPPQTTDVPPPPATQETLPPWLRDEAAQSPAADVPAWLREPEPPAQPPADVPAWLQETASAAPAATPPAVEDDRDTLPGTLRPNLAEITPEPPPVSAGPADDLPDWLRPSTPAAAPDTGPGQDLPPWLRDEAGQPLPTAGAAGDTNLPAWLRGAPIEATPAAPQAEPPPANFDWLDQAVEAEGRPTTTESEFFGGTELPAWLRPPEPEYPKEISQADARSLDWLTRLGGIEEIDTSAPAAVAIPKLSPPIARTRTPAQVEALALIERLVATPFPESAPVPERAQPSPWRRLGIERALYLALLIVLLIGLTVPLPDSFGLAAPPSAPGSADLFGQIDKLSENDVVLIGYEWDARRSGELRPLEDAVLGHLIQHKVKLVLVSTDPQGTLLLFDFRDQLERAGYRKGGEDYILLGYKPGAELALRSFAQDFRAVLMSDFQGNDATISALATGADPNKPRLANLNDFSMVMVLADEAQDVQGWMEQVHRSAPQVPFGFLLPAETAPVVQPYLSQPGIYHLAGKQGALAYQNLRGGTDMPAEQIAREVAQQRLSLIVFILLLLVGAIAVGASAAAGRRGRAP